MCPDDQAWALFLYGTLAEEEQAALRRHLDACATCRAVVADVAAISRQAETTLLFGKYRLGGTLGVGGMSTVHEAVHVALGRRVAIKMLGAELLDDADARIRFEREARAAASLDTPRIVRVLDVDVTPEGRPVIVMEHVSGRDLATALRQEGAFDAERVHRVAIHVAEALALSHEAGIVHRDLKPSNVLLSDAGDAKLLDFGLARWLSHVPDRPRTVTAEGAIVGTPQFLSPEQVRGERADTRTDVYGAGATLYTIATGEPPFAAPNVRMLMSRILRDPIVPIRERRPCFHEPLALVIQRCLSRSPEARFRDGRALLAALRDAGEPPVQRSDATATPEEPPR